jgi:PPP family 3-phenylpropionic acid transporter
VLVAAGLIQASHAELYSFGSIHWHAQGFTAGQIGILWAVGTGSEIVLFAVAGMLFRKVDAVWVIVIGGVAAIVRWSLFTLEPGFAGSFALQLLHSLSFGATFMGVQKAITEWIPEETTGGAQGFNVVVTSATLGIGTLVSGLLYEALGGHAFLAMVIPAAAGLMLVLLFRPSRHKRSELPRFSA